MAIIGTFTKTADVYRGQLTSLSLDVPIELRPVRKDNDKAPDYRIFAPFGEVGAAWLRTSAAERDYLSCKLDDLMFPAPVYASMVLSADDETYSLIWSR